MSQQERSSRIAVLLFTDMVDSVALQGRLGTTTYSRLLKLHHELFLQVLECVKGGQVRSDTGDGILSEFSTATDAVNAALLFQMLLREAKWDKEAPRVRIGIHQGQLAEVQGESASAGKIVGMPVNIAARVMSLAQGGQILMTRPVYDDARQFVREHPVAPTDAATPPVVVWKAHGEYLFKGSDDPVQVFEVGAAGFAPFTSPPNTDKARGAVIVPQKIASKWSPAIGAALVVFFGLALWGMPVCESWENASYDYLFLFGARPVTNKVMLILMDNEAYEQLGQVRTQKWSRALHTALLNKLADDGCPLVFFDVFFEKPGDPVEDRALAKAMQRQRKVALMAEQEGTFYAKAEGNRPVMPMELFLNAARTNWGVAGIDTNNVDLVVRKHWPFPSPGPHRSLPWTAARLAGAESSDEPQERWLRYYGMHAAWTSLSYSNAFNRPTNFFHDKIVFVGSDPRTPWPSDGEEDEFRTAYTRWTGESTGGVKILATEFLNLVNGDWLRRPAWWVEVLLVLATGVLLGGGLCQLRLRLACVVAAGAGLAIMLGAVCLSYFSNYWYPWLVVAGGQVPCALGWAIIATKRRISVPAKEPEGTVLIPIGEPDRDPCPLPDAPDYDLPCREPFGKGGFGKVWLARNAIGQWQALKVIYRSNFDDQRPYDMEYTGIEKYKPVSEMHPGLLRVEFVSRKRPEGYFYYIMELGDAQVPGWEENPAIYRAWTLVSLCAAANGNRLSVEDSMRIGIALAEALVFLHQNGLTHRDVKPANVIFVNGLPKLADVGLVTHARAPDREATRVGTPGYMPPEPEPQGTVQADIYALGMVLYVISTGRAPAFFPELSATLLEKTGHADFMRLNPIILKASQPDRAQRYKSAVEMHTALLEAKKALEDNATT